MREKQDCLLQAEKCFTAAKEDFLAQQLNEQARLLKHQADMEEQFHQPFVDQSLRETVMWLIKNGQNSRAEVLRKELKVADKQLGAEFCFLPFRHKF